MSPDTSVPTPDWVVVRAAHTDRIIEGAITAYQRDLQGDKIELDAFIKRMPEIAQNAIVNYKHGHDPVRGVVPLGPIIAWKADDKRVYIRCAVNKGNEIIDDIWTNEIQPLGSRAGFSIGGGIPPGAKSCKIENGRKHCDVSDVIVCEVSWTPHPANPGAKITYVNPIAKAEMDVMEKSETEKGVLAAVGSAVLGQVVSGLAGGGGQSAPANPGAKDEKCKPGCKCSACAKAEEEVRIKALETKIEATYQHFTEPVEVEKAIAGCGNCDDWVSTKVREGMSVAKAMLELGNMIANAQSAAVKNAQKEKEEELKPMADDKKKVPPEADETEKRQKSLDERLSKMEEAIKMLIEKTQTVGTGSGPLEGVPTTTMTNVVAEGMKTTKAFADTEEAAIIALVKMGYKIEGYQKAAPQLTQPKQPGNPSGIEPAQKDEVRGPWGKSLARAQKTMRGGQ